MEIRVGDGRAGRGAAGRPGWRGKGRPHPAPTFLDGALHQTRSPCCIPRAAPESLIDGRPRAIDEPMSTMLVEIYDALKEVGASEEKARAAATSLTGRDQRWDEADQRLQRVDQRLDKVERRLDFIEQALEALTRRIAALEEKVTALEQKIIALAQDVAVIRPELGLMKWMHGITIGGVLALLVKTFFG